MGAAGKKKSLREPSLLQTVGCGRKKEGLLHRREETDSTLDYKQNHQWNSCNFTNIKLMDVKSELGSDSFYTEITTCSSNLNKKNP